MFFSFVNKYGKHQLTFLKINVIYFFFVGKGSFGEIFLASNDTNKHVTCENSKYVVKIEPHSNGPLFVEIHCLLNTAKAKGKFY